MDLSKVINSAHGQILKSNRQWRIDGRLCQPTEDDVARLVTAMIDDIRNLDYDSIESGGILIRRDGKNIDVFVHLGGTEID